jgi:quercetin dioxygenase-like cupin family protein
VVLQGQLKVEFEAPDQADRVLKPGDLLVLPAHTRCRAYRWPRDQVQATVFLAVYPKE